MEDPMYKAIGIVAAVAAAAVPMVALPTAAHAQEVVHKLDLCITGTTFDAGAPLTLVANGPTFATFALTSTDTDAGTTYCSGPINVRPGQYQISFSGETPGTTHFDHYEIARPDPSVVVTDQPTTMTDVSANNYHTTFEKVTFVAAA
jgi:hypothetical protein